MQGNVNMAYRVFGDGDIDLVFVMGWVSHLEWFWEEPLFARFLRRLGTFARVILFDKRGTGLSDRVPLDQLPTFEQRMDDVRTCTAWSGWPARRNSASWHRDLSGTTIPPLTSVAAMKSGLTDPLKNAVPSGIPGTVVLERISAGRASSPASFAEDLSVFETQ